MRAIVIGTGVIGSAVGLALADHGLEVELIGPAGGGTGNASLAAGAMLGAYGEVTCPQGPAELAERALRVAAQRAYGPWLADIASRTQTHISLRLGTFVIANAAGARDRKNLTEIERAAHATGAPVERVEPEDVPWLRPATRVPAITALFLPAEGFVSAPDLMQALDEVNREHPRIRVTDGTVARLRRARSRVTGVVLEDGREVAGDWTVVAAGHGTHGLLSEYAGVLPRLVAGKGASITMRSADAPSHVIRTPNREFACGAHVVPRDTDSYYVGATNRISRVPGTNAGVTGGELHSLLHTGMHEINTSIRTATVERVAYGWRPLAIDHRPLVGIIDEGVAVATATYRNGVLMAPILARWVTEGLVQGRDPDENAFCPTRRGALGAISPTDRVRIIAEGARELLPFLTAPFGDLPYDRHRELSAFVETMIELVITEDDAHAELRQQIHALTADLPMPETVADLFYDIVEYARRQPEDAE
jgi:glycine oxidase